MVQQESYAQEIKGLEKKQVVAVNSVLKTLHPFIDNEFLIRVVERIQHFTLHYQTRHQMILATNHHFTSLIVSAGHLRHLHACPQLLIPSLRYKYWIPRTRYLVKTIIHQFLACHKLKAQSSQQFMGELRSSRIQKSRPFLNTGVDYAGSISLRVGTPRSKTIIKCYIAIFVCFATKAVHIEAVTSLTTEAFLAALRRFIARRGRPRNIHPDNGTNFQGAVIELHAVYKMLQTTSQIATIQDFMTAEGCELKFIPPHAPYSDEFGRLQ